MLRVNELIRRELGDLCERRIVSDLNALLTVTHVDTSPDLRQATVLVSVMGDEAQRRDALKLLHRNRGLFQREIARRTQLKYTPVLRFQLDETMEQADRVLAIIDELDLSDVPASLSGPPAEEEDAPEGDD